MQFYAFDENKQPIHAIHAKKNFNYTCIECQTRVRVRGGVHRQLHFYHLDAKRSCHLHGKGMSHLQLQNHLRTLLPKNQCFLEYRFPSVNRIADVAWVTEKIIFEIQCSPISCKEIRQRNHDYQSLGWNVVWILHDQRYNQQFLHPAEYALQDHVHYFSNMDANGKGVIYDQFDTIEKGLRIFKMEKLAVNLVELKFFKPTSPPKLDLLFCQKRLKKWPFYFEGDLCDSVSSEYYQQAVAFERSYRRRQIKHSLASIVKKTIKRLILDPYRVTLRYLLEKACR